MNINTFASIFDAKRNNFNFWRLFFAVLVIFSHSWIVAYGPENHGFEPLIQLTAGQNTFGVIAVCGFFLISGFLLTGSWQNSKGLLDFSIRRILRIFPALFVCLFACVFIVGPLGLRGWGAGDLHTYFFNPDTYRLFNYAWLGRIWPEVPGVFSTNPMSEVVNLSLWTIKYEVYCYMILALMGIMRQIKPVSMLIVFLSFYILYNVSDSYNPFYILNKTLVAYPFPLSTQVSRIFFVLMVSPMPHLLSFFLAGSVFYLWRDAIPRSFWLAILSMVGIGLSFHQGMSWTLPILGSYLLVYASLTPKLPLSAVGKNWDISYGVYLSAWPIQQLLVYYGIGRSHPILIFISTLPIVCLLAIASWVFVEKPCIDLKKRLFNRKQPLPHLAPSNEVVSNVVSAKDC